MPVYLAEKTPSTPKTANRAFYAKGLSGYKPSSISLLSVSGVVKYKEVAYQLYKTHIDAFVYATISKKKVFAQAEGFVNYYAEKVPDLPFTIPSISFSPAAKLTSDQASALLKKLGDGATMGSSGKTTFYTLPSATPTVTANLMKIWDCNFSTGPDHVSPLGNRVFHKVLSLINGFLATNHYPAFSDVSADIPHFLKMDVEAAGVYDDKRKRWYIGATEIDEDEDGQKAEQENHYIHKRRKLAKGLIADDTSMDVDKPEVLMKESWGYGHFQMENCSSSNVTAKPSGKLSKDNFGGPGAVPALPGILFPYFEGMMRPDFSIMKEICVNHFFRLFGSSFDECKISIELLKRGFNSLSNTESGMEICHALKGVDLALQTQTRLFLLFENGYKGFVLLGAHFSIFDGTHFVNPLGAQELAEELRAMDTHGAALKELAERLSSVVIRGAAEPVQVTSEEIATSFQLADQIGKRDWTKYDQHAEFDKTLQRLVWPRAYQQFNPDIFEKFLESIAVDSPLDLDKPIYIPSCRAPVNDQLFRRLAQFGADAPSLWTVGGEVYPILPGTQRKGKASGSREEETVTTPEEIIVKMKPILLALDDWEDRIFKRAVVSFNKKERAKAYSGHVIKNEGSRDVIWKKLIEATKKMHVEDDGPSTKRRRVEVDSTVLTSADAVLDLF